MLTAKFREVTSHWIPLAEMVCVPRTEAEYRQLVAHLDSLIDEIGEEETHPLASLMDVLGVLIEQYENHHVPELTHSLKIIG